MEDGPIIRRVKAGDREAFGLLVEKYHRSLLTFIHRVVGEDRMVEDIGQEVFLEVYRTLANFDERRGVPFSAWLFLAARNRCVSELRKWRFRRWIPLDDALEHLGGVRATLHYDGSQTGARNRRQQFNFFLTQDARRVVGDARAAALGEAEQKRGIGIRRQSDAGRLSTRCRANRFLCHAHLPRTLAFQTISRTEG